MLEFLKELKNEQYDAIFFIPGPKENSVHVEGSKYKDPGEKLNSSKFGLGDMYHTIIFKEDENGNVDGLELFEAIFSDPLEYISNMIEMDWYGLVCKKTTTSSQFVKDVFDKMKEE
jgi:hypothetical protein